MYRENVVRLGALVFLSAVGFLGAGLGLTGASAGASPVEAASARYGPLTPSPTFTRTSTPTATPTAVPPDCVPWEIVPSPNQGTYDDNALAAVDAISATDVWAVGYYGSYDWGFGCCNYTLAEHWDGTQWSIVPSPNPPDGDDNRLLGVAVLSPNDVWAVGFYGRGITIGSRTLIQHWNGQEWSIVPSPNTTAYSDNLTAIAAISANDIWAVGSSYNPKGPARTLIMHWDGIQWSIVPSPNVGDGDNVLTGVSATSSNDVWAVGQSSRSRTLTMRWNGTQWSIVPSPNAGAASNVLKGVAALSANQAWAVGYYLGSRAYQPLMLRWDGSQWSVASFPELPGSNTLRGVAASAADNVWAVGYDIFPYPDPSRPLIMHWNGINWSVIPAPSELSLPLAVAAVSATEAWTVGSIGRLTGTARYIESNCCTIEFSDVFPYDYFYNAVRHLSCMGAISGYEDGSFRPYANTTRAQLCKIIVLAEGWPFNTRGGPHFDDVPTSHPFYQYIETAYNRGIISGYNGPTFRPGNDVTRAQLCKIIVLAEGWPIDTTGGPHFSDVATTNPFYTYVETAYNRGIISGYSDGTFRPGNPATRGQIAKIVYNTITAP